MKGTRFVKGVAKSALNVPAWLSWQSVADQTQYIVAYTKNFFSLTSAPTGLPPEDFAEAMARLKLTEKDLAVRARQSLIMTVIYLVAAISVLIYGIVHLLDGSYLGLIIALGVTVYLLAQAFSNHFWYFQIKQRRLGCTFRDWFYGTFLGG